MQDVLDFADQSQPPRADGDPGQQVAEHRTQAEALGDAHGTIFKDRFLSQVAAFPQAAALIRRVHGSGRAVVLASSASGAEVGQAAIPGGAATAPVVSGGTLYVAGRDGNLHAYR